MEKILIIDDDKAYAETLKIVLSESFKNVDYVTLAKEGLNYVLSESPDVVITDLKMPEIDGLEVLRRVKEIDNYYCCADYYCFRYYQYYCRGNATWGI